MFLIQITFAFKIKNIEKDEDIYRDEIRKIIIELGGKDIEPLIISHKKLLFKEKEKSEDNVKVNVEEQREEEEKYEEDDESNLNEQCEIDEKENLNPQCKNNDLFNLNQQAKKNELKIYLFPKNKPKNFFIENL